MKNKKRNYRSFTGLLICALMLSACGQSDRWSGTKQLGATAAATYGTSVTTDSNGNVYVAGSTSGGLDGNTVTGSYDSFLTKYDSKGNRIYANQVGVAGAWTWSLSVTTDANDNVYVAGYTEGNLDGNTLTGTVDFFVTKYDSNGARIYTRQLGAATADTLGRSVATDSSGNVYVAGDTWGSLDGNTLTGSADMYVTKYDSTGVKQYTRQLGVAGESTQGRSVATDSSGNVYVAGHTRGNLDGNTLTGTTDMFLTKYDSSGVKQFTRLLGVSGNDTQGLSVATDGNDNVYVSGNTWSGLDGNTLTGATDFFVTKYDSNGTKQYTRQLGVAGATTQNQSVATDSNGNVYVAGYTLGDLDGKTLTGISDFFVTKYDSSGVKQYTRMLGAAGAKTLGLSVATDTGGSAYVAGYTQGNLDGNLLTGTTDMFVTKYSSSGTKQ